MGDFGFCFWHLYCLVFSERLDSVVWWLRLIWRKFSVIVSDISPVPSLFLLLPLFPLSSLNLLNLLLSLEYSVVDFFQSLFHLLFYFCEFHSMSSSSEIRFLQLSSLLISLSRSSFMWQYWWSLAFLSGSFFRLLSFCFHYCVFLGALHPFRAFIIINHSCFKFLVW